MDKIIMMQWKDVLGALHQAGLAADPEPAARIDHRGRLAASPRRTWIRSFTGSVCPVMSVTHVPGSDPVSQSPTVLESLPDGDGEVNYELTDVICRGEAQEKDNDLRGERVALVWKLSRIQPKLGENHK